MNASCPWPGIACHVCGATATRSGALRPCLIRWRWRIGKALRLATEMRDRTAAQSARTSPAPPDATNKCHKNRPRSWQRPYRQLHHGEANRAHDGRLAVMHERDECHGTSCNQQQHCLTPGKALKIVRIKLKK